MMNLFNIPKTLAICFCTGLKLFGTGNVRNLPTDAFLHLDTRHTSVHKRS